ncbi:helix-turn-helix and ligand-binding sensor domain-containing protein [Flavobacterium pallidum]|uniref:LuxR family transcriptional regulator n=2 Tax=Flavobacterium pallidum TaxID=2172098 RepID=A0A2S1SLN8_9FLAO|nr:LuxR family transcriptional regulator [Flavobacterium pallidum]
MMGQDKNHYIYSANTEGLIEFNGTDWKLYPTPNETIMRSVKVIGDKVYTGCYMEFGFWKRQKDGRLKYSSLSKGIKSKILPDEQFWNILQYDQWIIFQSLNRIYIYDSKSGKFNIIHPKSLINKAFKTGNAIYYQTVGEGLFEIENGKSILVSNNPLLITNKIVGLIAENDGLIIQTQFNGFYRYNNGAITKWVTEADEALAQSSVYYTQLLSDGGFALGCVSNGVFILSKEGKIRYHLTQSKGLSNNTALSLFEDTDKNLWIGLDNGINCVNLQSPVKSFTDDTGILGTVYASILHHDMLYVGTNQGLFCRDYYSAAPFQFVPGTKGQVWSLFEYGGTLFCGHDTGTYILNGSNAQHIFSGSGTWKFETVSNRPDLLLQGNYYGISVLQRTGSGWSFRNRITGFDYSAKYFELGSNHDIYISHEYKGVFRITVDDNFERGSGLKAYTTPLKGKNAGLTKFNGNIYYAYKEGVFRLNPKTTAFEKDKFLSSIFEKDDYTSGNLVVDNSNKLWLFTKNYINYFSPGKLSAGLKQNVIPIPASLTNSMLGYENISRISPSNYLIGTTDGYYTLNIDDFGVSNYNILITAVTTNAMNAASHYASIPDAGEFKYSNNNITFTYTIPEYNKYINAEYQYLLDGMQDSWSPLSSKSTISFKNLPAGSYTFKVRAKIGSLYSENIAAYQFTILKPWYATNLAVLIYIILLLVLAHFINKSYKNYYQKQKEKLIEENNLLLEIKELENEQQLMKIRNEQLTMDVDSKNRELAASTMSLIQKNELLTLIKDDLKKTTDDPNNRNIKSVITTINKNINEEDTWNAFKEAFNNADKDFLKKIKAAHPSLTPNDLRLCAYLRLNLSSKEIAPLLNISVRSVEIKRYRLRKKMDLSHEQGLVEYILAI